MEAGAVSNESTLDLAWTDPKRYLWLLGLIVPLAPFIAWGAAELTGLGAMWWLGPVIVYMLLPLLDMMIGKDSANPPESVLKWLEEDRYYRWCTYAFIPIQYAALVFACWQWAYGGLSFIESFGLALTVAMVGGIAINTASLSADAAEAVLASTEEEYDMPAVDPIRTGVAPIVDRIAEIYGGP